MKTSLLKIRHHLLRHRIAYALGAVLVCGFLLAARLDATVSFVFRLTRGLECSMTECVNEWNECFRQNPDEHGVVNLDEMQQVNCPPPQPLNTGQENNTRGEIGGQ